MTRQDGSSPSTSSGPGAASDGDYTRKLALAILSALQTRGLLSARDVDDILIAARRSAQQAMQNQAAQHQALQGQPLQGQAAQDQAIAVTVQAPASEVGVSGHPTPPPGGAPTQSGEEVLPVSADPGDTPPDALKADAPAGAGPAAPTPGEKQPPMFDIKLD